MQKIIILALLPVLVQAEVFVYDNLTVGTSISKAQASGYIDCQNEPGMGPDWLSCTSPKNFYPKFQGYNIDDVEIELPDGKTISAINLITSANVSPTTLAKKVQGTITVQKTLNLISISGHEDSLLVINGKIAILNNKR